MLRSRGEVPPVGTAWVRARGAGGAAEAMAGVQRRVGWDSLSIVAFCSTVRSFLRAQTRVITPEDPRGKRWSSGKGWRERRKSGSASKWKRRHPAREMPVAFRSSSPKKLDFDDPEKSFEVSVPFEEDRSQVVVLDGHEIGAQHDGYRVFLDDTLAEIHLVLVVGIRRGDGTDDFSELLKCNSTSGV